MKVCEECGKEFKDYYAQCPSCYSSNYRIKEIKKPLEYYRTCSACGTTFDYGIRNCPHCGSNSNAINIKNSSSSNYNYTPIKGSPTVAEPDGSFALGFVLTFFLGFIPLIIICGWGAERTRVGAAAAGIISLIVGLILAIIRISILLG